MRKEAAAVKDVPLKNPAALLERLALESANRLLLVDAPPSLASLLGDNRPIEKRPASIDARAIRSVKEEDFDAILVWREDRAGSRSLFDAVLKRLSPQGVLWVVTALKKVMGVTTPASRRLERSDLEKAFAAKGLSCDRETRVSAWHVGYRFVKT